MLDEFSRVLVESSRLPTSLSGEDARNLVSGSYLDWLAQQVFGAATEGGLAIDPAVLSRLSLATSILQGRHDEHLPTIFLTAEASDIAQTSYGEISQEDPPAIKFRRAIHQLDIASYYHLADYDANAGILARNSLHLLTSNSFAEYGVDTEAQLSYYLTLAHFLQGHFGLSLTETDREVAAELAEDRAFAFLKRYLACLVGYYLGEDIPDNEQARIAELSRVLDSEDHPFSVLSAEVERLIQFSSAIDRKSLYRVLAPILEEEQAYLNARVGGLDNQGYPFAWPPAQEFCEHYFEGDSRHAVITAPTGAGKSLLAEFATVQALRSGWVLYIAPTNALCTQIREDLSQGLRSLTDVEIEAFPGGLEYIAELPEFRIPRNVLAITPEKALLLLKREPNRFRECSLVVLDECHILGESDRGGIAETVLAFALSQNPGVRVILMSALLQDSRKLALWLQQRTNQPVAEIPAPTQVWRPTRTARLAAVPDWQTHIITETDGGSRQETVGIRIFADVVTPWEEETPLHSWLTPVTITGRENRLPWRNEVSRKLAELLVDKGVRTLIFVLHNRHHAFSIANDFNAALPGRPEVTQEEQDLYTLAEYELGATTLIESLIRDNGAAVHTSTMLDCERKASEIAFASGRALLLTATGTLSQGLNLPAQAVIICGTHLSEYGDSLEMDPEELERRSLNQVLNAAGRAARANIACRGLSVIVPDGLLHGINEESPKAFFLQNIEVLAMREASLPVNSSLLERVNWEFLNEEPNNYERMLLSQLPPDPEALRLTIQNSLGAAEENEQLIEQIIRRLEVIRAGAINSGYSEWMLRASSVAGMDYSIAGNLKDYIERISTQPDFLPPNDTYSDWAAFLIRWLRTLPVIHTWDILRMHIKAWRHYWGRDKDPDLLTILEEAGYSENILPELAEVVEPVWDNMSEAVDAWLEGRSLVEIGEVLTRRHCPTQNKSKRTHAGHYLPRTITWSQRYIERLSRFAGLLLALHDHWIEAEADSVPAWFADTVALPTFPLGLRFGVRDPFALAWHRYVMPERRAADLLQTLFPLDVENVIELRSTYGVVRQARRLFMRDRSHDNHHPVVPALRRLIIANQ